MAKTGRPKQLRLVLDEVLETRLDSLLSVVAGSATAVEFGVVVDRGLVARIALLRGLESMEAAGAGVMDRGRSVRSRTPEVAKSRGDDGGGDAAESVVESEGLVEPPTGWRPWSASEQLPEAQWGAHEYYEEAGWVRYYGTAPTRTKDEVIVFYWCSDRSLQGLELYDSGLKVQATPWGPGHLIPHGWVESGSTGIDAKEAT